MSDRYNRMAILLVATWFLFDVGPEQSAICRNSFDPVSSIVTPFSFLRLQPKFINVIYLKS